MEFKYTAQDAKGKRITAQLNAESVAVLVSQLKNKGLLPLQVKEIASEKKKERKSYLFQQKIKLKELSVFTRQLASALNAGLLLTEALETIRSDLENRYFGGVLDSIIYRIRAGSSFSAALMKYPNIFSGSYVAIVKAGEESGGLTKTLTDLANYLEDTERVIRKIKSATHYPIFLVVFCIIIVSLIVFFVIPKFKLIFAEFNFPLPLITRIVVWTSEVATKNILWFIVVLVISVLLFKFISKFPRYRLRIDHLKLRIFFVGKIMKKLWITRFSRTLSSLLSGGVGLVAALPISCEVANNLYLKQIIEDIKNSVVGGATLSTSFKKEKIFPGMFVKMIQVGEKTGKLSEMLKRNADHYENELEEIISAFSALVEPVLIVFVGSIVGVVVIAFYMPIFKISQLIK